MALTEAPEQEVDEAKALARQEGELAVARRKELKATAMDSLKTLVEAQGLELGKKEDMVERLMKHEAKVRAEARAQEARVRQVLIDMKAELEALSINELRERSVEQGVKGQLSKQARVESLIKLWQEDDGVDKALAKKAHDEREQELTSLGAEALLKLCDKVGVDPFVKEVMVDRIVKREHAAGRFGRPTLAKETQETTAPAPAVGGDVVAALMASEANRKKEREMKKQEEELAAKKKADLQSKSVDQLKKLLVSKGRTALGKKDEMIDELLQIGVQEEAAAKRKLELKAKEPAELKKLLQSKALEVSNKKDDMVETFLAYEAQVCEAALAYGDKVDAVLAEKSAEWEPKTLVELKELCASKDIKLGLSKGECLERLAEDFKTSGEVDRALAAKARAARREELLTQSKEAVHKRCIALEIDPLVKEVMVERVLAYEAEFGRVDERAAKRARTSKSK